MEPEPQTSSTSPSRPPTTPGGTSAGGAGSAPRGILKHPSTHEASQSNPGRPADAAPTHLAWDEANIAETDADRGSKMKITEPKTPFVRYDPETDTVMDLDQIPNFELGTADPPRRPSMSSSASSTSGTSSRHSSFSSSRRSSDSGEKRVDIVLDESAPAGGLPDSSEEDESRWDEATRIRHTVFKNMRKSHYGNEAEAMRRAKQLAEQDEEALEDEVVQDNTDINAQTPPVPPLPSQNGDGTAH